jgi:hypothetical protein
MTGLKQECEMLKQLTEIERMKKELQELKGDKTGVADNEVKQVSRLGNKGQMNAGMNE